MSVPSPSSFSDGLLITFQASVDSILLSYQSGNVKGVFTCAGNGL